MSSTYDQPHRSWWQKSSTGSMKFNTLASAMGLKPKKAHPPALIIQDSPYPIISTPGVRLVPRSEPNQRRPYTAPSSVVVGRPPSNSVSSYRSRADSIEPTTPKTPDDAARARRGSLLTLSDADPFAARVVSPHSPSDPNRLSAFSNSSATDTKSNESVNRVSYASSSSQSYRMGGDLSPLSVLSPASEAGSSYMRLSNKISGHSLRRKDLSNNTWLSSLGGETNRFSQPDPPPQPRPAMRARGMTDGGIERSNFLRSDPFVAKPIPSPNSPSASYQSASSSKIPSRQISLSRPTPPPSHELPPPPRSAGGHSAGSASSSSLTFSVDFMPIAHSPRVKAKTPSPPRPVDSGWEPDVPSRSPPRTLRKSVSHQSLTKRGHSSSSASSATVPLPEPATVKVPRKQRSFHQHRLPVPAIPLQLPLSEQRASEPAQSTRKRLFSGSSARRPSQSTTPIADDARSLTTASEHDRAPSTSCWIDTDPPPRSPTSAVHEYTPQQIMSPAEMLRVEASVNAAYQRPRGESIASTSMSMSNFEHEFGLSPSTSFGGGRSRSNSDHPSMRSSSTSEQANTQDMYYLPMAPQPPSPLALMSLPPPPRRTKPRAGSLSRSQSEIVTPLSPPPRRNLRPKISVEERMHRQSIMRKPSFLDIEDEMDKEPTLLRQGSFLDLTRVSFDSVESTHSLDYN
ncbi:hypothetical protein B0H17DRAFT_1125792 [Mycena rosella]|uniref:Uncharacterized protein n=1 Tax=Mycena rosella TaxID=1033263 RepID=A0AAD7GUY8_MYCRO|nr:hypothetical protein B0H17DRAFT_1125792 [Mycena rosella]